MTRIPYQLGASTVTRRTFSGRGAIRVRVGDRVQPETVLGTDTVPGEPLMLSVAAALRQSPDNAAGSLLLSVGERVPRGGLVARFKSREVRAPEAGILTGYDSVSGLATLMTTSADVEVRAGVAGVVTEMAPGRSVSIETRGALVTGVWGVGQDVHGVVRTVVRGPSDSVAVGQLDQRYTYSILVVGASLTADVLRRCEQLEVRAVVAAGMTPRELGNYLGTGEGRASGPPLLPPPGSLQLRGNNAQSGGSPAIMLLEGFGEQVFVDQAWEVLKACDGKEGFLQVSRSPEPPRLVVALPAHQAPDPRPVEEAVLAAGATVRVLGWAGEKALATVVRAQPARMGLPSGAGADAVAVRTADGAEALVPIVNLRVIQNA